VKSIYAINEVFDAIQRAKAEASSFTTNCFPNNRKLQDWIDRGELFAETFGCTALFGRVDRDFWHLYFCAPDQQQLHAALTNLPELRTERFVVDLIGVAASLEPLLSIFQSTAFRRYKSLYRMARAAEQPQPPTTPADERIGFAHKKDSQTILDLICQSFDKYAEQLPVLSEIETATECHQILAARNGESIAGLLYFEDQGFTSTVRYWLVDRRFRDRGFGSALMRYYLHRPSPIRRFILWVIADNLHAIAKYRQHGFAPEGLLDYVLANQMILS